MLRNIGRPKIGERMRLPNGTITRMYTRGEVAKALGRRPETIRDWKKTGVIPDSGLRDEQGREM